MRCQAIEPGSVEVIRVPGPPVALWVKVPAGTETLQRSGLGSRESEIERWILAGEEVGGGQLERDVR